jgi:hypothetical protein
VTTLDRQLQQITSALSPTEAVVRWLEEAKSHGAFGVYWDWLEEHPSANPFTAIPRQVAAWARQDVGKSTDRATTERVGRAVRSALVRFELVEWMNRTLINGAQADAHQVELLQLLAPLVLTGRVDLPTENAWGEHAGRLVDEARLWSESAALIGDRYLAGHAPLFPDVARYLDSLQANCETLLADYNHAVGKPRGRKPQGTVVDLHLIDAHVAELLPAQVAALLRIARTETEVHLGERERQLSIPRLIGMGEQER